MIKGTPLTGEGNLRTYHLNFWLTSAEHRRLLDAARASRYGTVASYIRAKALYNQPPHGLSRYTQGQGTKKETP